MLLKGRTLHKLHESPQTEHNEERRELALAATKSHLEHERREHDDRIEEVQRGVWHGLAKRIVVARTERPHGDGNFDEEEGGDRQRDLRECVQPRGRVGALDGRALGREEGVGEVRKYACRVDEDLAWTLIQKSRDSEEKEGRPEL